VRPAKPFNPIEDSERLNEAMSGFGTDEDVVVDILPRRTNDQRQEIRAKYQDKYNKVNYDSSWYNYIIFTYKVEQNKIHFIDKCITFL
jgi:hypothetical protein